MTDMSVSNGEKFRNSPMKVKNVGLLLTALIEIKVQT